MSECYVVEECVENEGSTMVGVFSTWDRMYAWVQVRYPEATSVFSRTFAEIPLWRGPLGGDRYLEVREHQVDPEPLGRWVLLGALLHRSDCRIGVANFGYRFEASLENAAEVARLMGVTFCVSCDEKEEK